MGLCRHACRVPRFVVHCGQAGVHPVLWQSCFCPPSSELPAVTYRSPFVHRREASWSLCLIWISPNASRGRLTRHRPVFSLELCYPPQEMINDRATLLSVLKSSMAHTGRPYFAPCRKEGPRRGGIHTTVVGAASEVERYARHVMCVCRCCMLRTSHGSMCPVEIPQHARYDHLCSLCVNPHSCVFSAGCHIRALCSAPRMLADLSCGIRPLLSLEVIPCPCIWGRVVVFWPC